MMTVKVRFAPSPTGYLHIGNVRTALINWLFARKNKGHFLLRLDDTDLDRSKKEYEDGIYEDLSWLGLSHDSFFKQSDRFDRYKAVVDKLIASGRLYPCYETPEELDFKRKRQLGRGQPPLYDRAALQLTAEQKETLENEGRRPHYRFLLEDKDIAWHDMVRGDVHFGPRTLSDPVLVRADGAYLYTLTSVVDDVDTDITHIMRGEDHVTNTAVQIQLFEALGKDLATLTFGHTTLLMDKDGAGLSKRIGSLGIRQLRDEGLEPLAICGFLARLGTSLPMHPFATMEEIVDQCDISTFSRTAPRFDEAELFEFNHKLLVHLPFEKVAPKLNARGMGALNAKEWDLIKGNLETQDDWDHWFHVFHGVIGDIDLKEEDYHYLKMACDHLPQGDLTQDTWGEWTSVLKTLTERKGKALFLPLRLALTGLDHGPEMKDVLPLLGRACVLERLKG